MLALVEAGLSREHAYKIVQRHSMQAWEQETPLRALLEMDPEVTAHLDAARLDGLFDAESFLIHIDESFRRVGLIE
jgi:adenylosuccinate lyase